MGMLFIRPYTVVGPALGAGIGQWEDEPPGWGQGGDGYASLASGVGRSVISETIRFGFAAADGEDPRYHRSNDSGVWPRARHAIAETFTSHTESGARIPAFSRFAGTLRCSVYFQHLVSGKPSDRRLCPATRLNGTRFQPRGSTSSKNLFRVSISRDFMSRTNYMESGEVQDPSLGLNAVHHAIHWVPP